MDRGIGAVILGLTLFGADLHFPALQAGEKLAPLIVIGVPRGTEVHGVAVTIQAPNHARIRLGSFENAAVRKFDETTEPDAAHGLRVCSFTQNCHLRC